MTTDITPGTLLGIQDADLDRAIVVPEKDPAKAKDLLDALRGAGEPGGIVLVGGWEAHEAAEWEDLTDAVEPLLVFQGYGGPNDEVVLDHVTERYGAELALKFDTERIGTDNIAARLRRDQPITTVDGSYLFGPGRKVKAKKGRTEPDTPRAKVFRASDLKAAEQPRWLAKNRIPRSAISLLVGDEGIGKSLFWVWIVAAITTGRALLAFGIPARDPADVLLVITEDDWSSTVRPRLEVAGADLDRVSVICTETDGSGAPVFPDEINLVSEATPVPALVVVDAWLDTVPAKLSVRDPQQARLALHPWKDVAVTTGAAVLLITHTNRVASASPRDKYGATAELRKKARMALFAQRDDEGHLVIGPEKSNASAPIAATLFTIDGVQFFKATEDHDGVIPRLRCIGQSDKTSSEMIVDQFNGPTTDDDDVSGRRHWLRTYLMDAGEPVKSKDVKDAGRDEGYSARSLERAAQEIQVEITRTKEFPSVTCWSKPAALSAEDLRDSGQ